MTPIPDGLLVLEENSLRIFTKDINQTYIEEGVSIESALRRGHTIRALSNDRMYMLTSDSIEYYAGLQFGRLLINWILDYSEFTNYDFKLSSNNKLMISSIDSLRHVHLNLISNGQIPLELGNIVDPETITYYSEPPTDDSSSFIKEDFNFYLLLVLGIGIGMAGILVFKFKNFKKSKYVTHSDIYPPFQTSNEIISRNSKNQQYIPQRHLCGNCGLQVEEDDLFCSQCGTQVMNL